MTPPPDPGPRWDEIEAALDRLIDLAPADRPRAIDRLAAGSAEMRARLTALSAGLEADDPLFDRPAAALLSDPNVEVPGALPERSMIGPWRIVGLLGRGGMGEVYRAERADGLYRQEVALKLVRLDMAQDVHRFEVERQTLALLEHPSIARLVDGGLAADGRPYMALELVQGETITAWCRSHDASLADRLHLVAQVCDAVAHAHRNLVVHLDIKPNNVLVNAEGRVKLLDFGIARLLQGADTPAAQTRQLVLTPAYCAPEQLAGEAVTTAADVYSLGLLLHELLVGEPALPVEDQPLAAAIDRVVRGTLAPPSRHAARVARPAVPPAQLRGDLDAIVAKATRRDPLRRYASVAGLREDLDRHLRHEAVAAREGARLYALGRLLDRHRALATSVGVSMLALAVGAGTVAWQAHRLDIEARKAVAERDFLIDIFRQNSNENPGGAHARETTAEQLLDLAARRIKTQLRDQREVRAELMETLFAMFDQLQKYPRMVTFERDRLDEIERLDGPRPSKEKAAVQFGLGRSLMMTGDNTGGEAQLKAAMATLDALGDRRSSLRADVLMHLARIATRRRLPGDAQAAEAAATQAQALYPHDDMNWLYAGQVIANAQLMRGDLQAALHQLRPLVEAARRPPFDATPITLTFLESDFGRQLAIANHVSEGMALVREAVQLLTRLEGADKPDTSVARGELAWLELRMNNVAESDAQMRRALDALSRTPGPDDRLWTAPIRLQDARRALMRGDLVTARAQTERVLATFDAEAPTDRNHLPRVLVLEAGILAVLGRDDAAQHLLDRARALWPRDDAGRLYPDTRRTALEGLLQARAGLAQPSQATFDDMRSRGPASAGELPEDGLQADLTQAQVDLEQGHSEAARVRLEPLLARIEADADREFLGDAEARARYLRGAALLALGRDDEAAAELQRALTLRLRTGIADSVWTAQVRVALARAHLALHDGPAARALMVEARRALSAQGAASSPLASGIGVGPAVGQAVGSGAR